jgi:hypothetical protein
MHQTPAPSSPTQPFAGAMSLALAVLADTNRFRPESSRSSRPRHDLTPKTTARLADIDVASAIRLRLVLPRKSSLNVDRRL